jgi:NADH-quinone oxidoreductase subunit M
MTEPSIRLAGLAALPVLIVAASWLTADVERLRRMAVLSAATMLAGAMAVVVRSSAHAWSIQTSVLSLAGTPEAVVRLDGLSSVLLPFAASLWLLTVAVTPRAALDRVGLRRTATATFVTVLSFLTESAVVLVAVWVVSGWTLLAALTGPEHRHSRRVAAAYFALSTLLFGAGVVLASGAAGHGALETAGLWMVALAVLVRQGIVPFHAWVPEVFDLGRLGPAILFSAPQLGAYVAVILVVPRAPAGLLTTLALLALVTAVYGAALALVQTSARRACGYLFISQSALVMAGLAGTSVTAVAAGLVVWLSAGVAFAGLARCVLVLEARRGRLDLNRYHGGYDRMPMLAIAFLVTGLACTGFPGTLGFVGQELLVRGTVAAFPVMGFAVVVASALTGLAVLRMYFALFCGRPAVRAHAAIPLGLTTREAWTFVVLVAALIGLGMAPRALVDSRLAAGEVLLHARAIRDVPSGGAHPR